MVAEILVKVTYLQTTVAQLNEMNKHLVLLVTGQKEQLAYADVSKANGKARTQLVGNSLLRDCSSDE